jgi:hypothetical protein
MSSEAALAPSDDNRTERQARPSRSLAVEEPFVPTRSASSYRNSPRILPDTDEEEVDIEEDLEEEMSAEHGETRSKSDPSKPLPDNPSEPVVKEDFLTEEEADLIEQAAARIAAKRMRDVSPVTIKWKEQAVVRMRPARQEAALFDGKEVTEFLDEYNRQADNALLSSQQKVRILPDYCDTVRRTFIKKMRSYLRQDWGGLQEDMLEHWRDNDTSQRRGTRAYLEAYVRQCSESFPGISDYYTNFLVTSDAGILSKQVHESERGYLFFRGLPRPDKELVLFSMPEPRPEGSDVATYNMDRIYKYVRLVYRQREGIKQTSFSQAEEDTRRARAAIQDSRRVTSADIQAAVGDLENRRRDAANSSLPPGVDKEVQELIDAMKGAKISLQEIDALKEHPAIGPLLREGRNYVYFLSHVSNSSSIPQQYNTRNDGSYVTNAPLNVNMSKGTVRQGQGEYRDTCNMCNESGHHVRDCELYQNLIRMGWISFSYDRDARRTTWFYGPNHHRLGEVQGPAPPSLQYHWLQGKIREFFEVTNDVLDTPASQCKPERFEGRDSRPARYQGNNRGGYRPPASTPQLGQGNTVTIRQRGEANNLDVARSDLAEFLTNRMIASDDESGEVMLLDHVDASDIVMGRTWHDSGEANAASTTRSKSQGKQTVDAVLDQVRENRLQKKVGRPRKTYDPSRLSREVSGTPIVRGSPTGGGMDEGDYRMDEDSQTLVYPSQEQEAQFPLITPPQSGGDYRYLSADPDNLQPQKKKKVQFDGLPEGELQALLKLHPNKIPTAMLKQEVRGVTIADLLGERSIRGHIEKLLESTQEESPRFAEANIAMCAKVDASDRTSQSEHARSRLANLAPSHWPTSADLSPHIVASRIEKECCEGPVIYQRGRKMVNFRHLNHITVLGDGEEGSDKQDIVKTIGAAQANTVGQSRHQVAGSYDTYNSTMDEVTHRSHRLNQKVNGLAFVQSDLPVCWAEIGTSSVRCLIDTGAQMNLLRKSAALAMQVVFEEFAPGTSSEGVVSANGSTDSFVGTAWDVSLKIGQVVTTTHFRIVEKLTRSAILGAPWCASARLCLQYNVFGRVTCRILDSNGKRNATFIASDPAPFHPKQLAQVDDDEDSEN